MSTSGLRRYVANGFLPSYARPGSRKIYVRADEVDDLFTPRPRAVGGRR